MYNKYHFKIFKIDPDFSFNYQRNDFKSYIKMGLTLSMKFRSEIFLRVSTT